MWKFMQMIVSDLDKMTNYARDNQDAVKQLLKEAPNITT